MGVGIMVQGSGALERVELMFGPGLRFMVQVSLSSETL